MAARESAAHEAATCARVRATERYSNKNWSAEFCCPVCGARQRRSLNYLGRRSLVCEGGKWKTQ